MLATKRDLVAKKNYQYYLITNTRGDVIETRNGDGNVNARFVYDAWGKLISVTDANGNALSADSFAYQISLKYRGYVYDNETGLYYLQSRYYDPETGRFLNADDVRYIGYSGEQLSYNIFAYCENEPVTHIDIWGYTSKSLIVNTIDQLAQKALSEVLYYLDLDIIELNDLKRNEYYIYEIVIEYRETGGIYKGRTLELKLTFGDANAWLMCSQWDNCLNFYAQLQVDYTSDMINSPIEDEEEYFDFFLQLAFLVGIIVGAYTKQQYFKSRYNLIWGENGLDPLKLYNYYLFDMDFEKYGDVLCAYSLVKKEVVFC